MENEIYKSYLLLGPEIGRKQEYIDKLKTANKDAELYKFYPFDNQMDQLFEVLGNESLFAPSRLVVLEKGDQITNQKDLSQLISYIKNPSDNALLIICSEENFLKKTSLQNCFTKGKNLFYFYELFESDKDSWLKNFFNKEGFRISSESCQIIKEQIENNLQEFRNICTQMVIYYKTKDRNTNEITVEDIEDFLTHTRTESEESLFGYIAKLDLESSLDCLHTLIRQTDVTKISIFKIWLNFRNFLSYKIKEQTGTDNQIFSTDRKFYTIKEKFIFRSCSNNFSQTDIERILEYISDFDLKLKQSGTFIQPILWEQFIYNVIYHKGTKKELPAFASYKRLQI